MNIINEDLIKEMKKMNPGKIMVLGKVFGVSLEFIRKELVSLVSEGKEDFISMDVLYYKISENCLGSDYDKIFMNIVKEVNKESQGVQK